MQLWESEIGSICCVTYLNVSINKHSGQMFHIAEVRSHRKNDLVIFVLLFSKNRNILKPSKKQNCTDTVRTFEELNMSVVLVSDVFIHSQIEGN